MELLTALQFARGAVARKDFVPALTNFNIRNGRIKGFNGNLGLCSPIDCEFDISPHALQFIRAINACKETVALHVAANGKLVVRSGDFKAFVDCGNPADFPDITPAGESVKLSASLLPALRYLEPFLAEDATRPWACSVLFDGESAFATNNIVLLQYWLGFKFPRRVSIPAAAVRELLRIGEPPVRLQSDDRRLTFHYEDGRWLSTQVIESAWPDVVALLDRSPSATEPVPDGFWPALEQLLPFCDEIGRCHLLGDRLATVADADVAGASIALDIPGLAGCFNGRHLFLLKDVAECIDFSAYPNAVPFNGPAARGVIAGIRT